MSSNHGGVSVVGRKSWTEWLFWGATAVVVIIVGMLGTIPFFVSADTLRRPLEASLSQALRRTVTLGQLQVQTFGTTGIRANQVKVVNAQGQTELTAQELLVQLNFWSLLTQKLDIQGLHLTGANLSFQRGNDGTWNIDDLVQAPQANTPSLGYEGPKVSLNDSTILLSDQKTKRQQQLTKVQLELNPRTPFNLDLDLRSSLGAQSPLTVLGTIQLPQAARESWTGDLQIEGQHLNPEQLVPYLGEYPGLKGLQGDLDVEMRWQLGREPRISGTVQAHRLNWRWPEVWGRWQAQDLTLKTDLLLKNQQVVLDTLQLTGKTLDLTLSGLLPRTNPTITPLKLQLQTTTFDPFQARNQLPLGLFAPALRNLLNQSQGTGQLQAQVQFQGTLRNPSAQGTILFQKFALQRLGSNVTALSNLQGQLNFTPQQLQFQDIRGQIGRSDFRLVGLITGYRTSNPQPQLTFQSPALDLSRSRGLLALSKNSLFNSLRTLTGTAAVDLQFQGQQTRGRIELQGVQASLSNFRPSLEDLRGVLTLTGDGFQFANLSARIAQSPLSFSGSLTTKGNLQLRGQGTLQFPQILTLLPPSALQSRGSAPLTFTFLGTTTAGRLTGDLDLSGLRQLQLNGVNLTPARRLTLSGTFSPTQFTLAQTRLSLGGLTLEGAGVIRNQQLNLTLRTVQPLSLNTLNRFIPELAQLGATTGQAIAALKLQGTTRSPQWQTTLDLQGVTLPNLLGGIRSLNGTVLLTANQASSPGLRFQSARGPALLQGTLQNFQKPRLNFVARFAELDLDRFLAEGGSRSGAGLGQLQGQGRLYIDQGRISRLSFQNLQAQLTFADRRFTLNRFTLATAGGQMNGTLTSSPRQVQGQITLRNGSADILARQLLNFPAGQIYGSTNLDLTFQGSGSTPNQFLNSLEGGGSLRISNGQLAQVDLLGPILGAAGSFGRNRTLSLDTLFSAVSRLNTGRFQRLGGDFIIQNGVASTDNFRYQGQSLSMNADGTLRLANRSADLYVQGQLTNSPSGDFVQGLLGGLLGTRQPRNQNFSFQVRGPINQFSSVQNLRLN